MVYPMHFDTISKEFSTSYFQGVAGQDCFKMMYFCPLNTFRISTNSEDPDEMPSCAAFHPGLHCLLKYLSIGIKNENGSIKIRIPFEIVKIDHQSSSAKSKIQ